MANNRIYYACQNVQINGPSGVGEVQNSDWDSVQGLQSVGMTTNFNLEPIYQLGQLELYDNYEEIPEVEVTLNKVLDGSPTLYAMTMGTGTLSALSNHRCGVRLNLFADTSTLASGAPLAQVSCVPAYLSSVTYTFPTEGNFTEEVTLVSNDKVWATNPESNATGFLQYASPIGQGILRRNLWNSAQSVLPSAGSGGLPANSKVQSVSVSMNLGRESIFNLGQRTPFYRYVNFPVEITCEIEIVAHTGDMVGAAQDAAACSNPKALENKQIKIVLCDGTVIDLGHKNKLTSVNYTGGDTGGGNATITYSYQTFNDFTYTAPTGVTISEYIEEEDAFPLT